MLIHVTVRYPSEENPVEDRDGLRGLVAFGEWMERQSEFPDVTPVHVHWAAEKPPAAYGLFEAPTVEALRAYLTRLPQPATLDLRAVRPLPEVMDEGRGRVGEWMSGVRR